MQNWETCVGYPKAETLQRLIASLLNQGALTPGDERAEALALWEQAAQAAPHPFAAFDATWFARALAARNPPPTVGSGEPQAATATPSAGQSAYHDVSNLPFQPTPLIGRSEDLAEIAELLRDPACRLLTLVGPGGIGKTRLAIEVAAAHAPMFPDGVAFVTLPLIDTPGQIVAAIIATLGVAFAAYPDPTTPLLAYLRYRHMLIVLDNFEHLLAGTDLITAMLAAAPQIRLIVTSRERLNLQAEWLFDVAGLAYPSEDLRGAPLAADLSAYSAVQLFVQRATQILPQLERSAAVLATIGRICQHAAGMPLAIELAAAGMRTLPLPEIEWQIRTNLDVLTTTLRDVPARYRSLRAVFDHSWNLLSEPERALWSQLAVFRGSWTVEAAEQVAGATLPALAALIDKSLVRQERAERHAAADAASQADTEPRFAMLEPIREYALSQLMARGAAAAIQRAHASYYLALAEAAAAQ